eukprot:TRINITY_DN32075_c0_g1_i1.p1 TRINITY_DN32075_c0_g1~~TRINITY_DN32075_c0_g1_i1.p1  ORF type:complete len:447 (+),score=34.87 TRINITY_DN32075_c0_g1_i1:82-1341(+)
MSLTAFVMPTVRYTGYKGRHQPLTHDPRSQPIAGSWLYPCILLTSSASSTALMALGRSRRQTRFRSIARKCNTADGSDLEEASVEYDGTGRKRLCYKSEGWNTWTWKAKLTPNCEAYQINYIASGPEAGTPVVLVHGFGASSYHWRYQVPTLSERGCRVYSICLLGYGWSPRAVLPYTGEVWAAQINDFLRDVVGKPAVLVGNSVGAFASLLAAAQSSQFCAGLVMLNAAGRFEERQPGTEPAKKQLSEVIADAAEQAEPGPVQWLLNQVTRAVASWAFYTTKIRIKPILEWVYVNAEQVDDELVTSIRTPADHPDALDTFGQVIQAGRRTDMTVFEALDNLPSSLPILLIWGMQDPWMRPTRAEAILSECARRGLSCDYVEVSDAGHCPQDDTPEAVNEALSSWLCKERLLGAATLTV